jgi:hypothetical protein
MDSFTSACELPSASVKKALFFLILWAITAASYVDDFFHVTPYEMKEKVLNNADSLVVQEIVAATDPRSGRHGGFLVFGAGQMPQGQRAYRSLPGVLPDPSGRIPYVSQFGLQGQILTLLGPPDSLRVPAYVSRVRILDAVVLATTMIGLLALAAPVGGYFATAVAGISLAWSPWLVAFATGMYWQLWFAFLPFLATTALMRRRNVSVWLPAIATATLVFLRALMSYEYITCIALAGALPMIARDVATRQRAPVVLRRAAILLAAGWLAIGAAVAAHLAKLAVFTGSWRAAGIGLAERLAMRTYGTNHSGFAYPTGGRFRGLIEQHFPGCHAGCENILFAARYLTLPAVTIPYTHASIPIGAIVVLTAALGVRRWHHTDEDGVRAEAVAILSALVASLSWIVVMYHHALDHLHIDAIAFYLPFLPLAYVYLARDLGARLSSRWTRGARPPRVLDEELRKHGQPHRDGVRGTRAGKWCVRRWTRRPAAEIGAPGFAETMRVGEWPGS